MLISAIAAFRVRPTDMQEGYNSLTAWLGERHVHETTESCTAGQFHADGSIASTGHS